MVTAKLVWSNLAAHRARAALTIAAISLSVALVVAVTCGYASIEAAAGKFLDQYLGATDATITQHKGVGRGVPASLIDLLRADPDVQHVVARIEQRAILHRSTPSTQTVIDQSAQVVGLVRSADRQIDSLKLVQGRWFTDDQANVAVIDQGTAADMKLAVGDSFHIPGANGELTLNVVGIVHKPELLAAHMKTVYLPLHTLQQFLFPQGPPQVSRILISLRPGADLQRFASRWRDRLSGIDPTLAFRLARESRQQLDKNLFAVQVLSYLGGTVSMLAATFIVVSALSMGVSERTRVLGMLRAVGMHKAAIARLVVLEAIVLSGAGALIGVPLGLAGIATLAAIPRFSLFFAAGLTVSWGGLVMATIGTVAAAVLASLIPAFAAARVSPLQAMSNAASPLPRPLPLITAIVGLLLICLDPILVHRPFQSLMATLGADLNTTRTIQFYGHFVTGLPATMIGFLFVAPLLIHVVERLSAPLIGAGLRLPFPLLRQQLSTGLWRAAGTCAALMVGLATLLVLQIQGRTLLGGWKLPDRFPDIFIVSLKYGGLSPQEQQTLNDLPEIRPLTTPDGSPVPDSRGQPRRQVMPIAIAAPGLSNVFLATFVPESTMFFGIDPDLALAMLDLDFIEGSAPEAARQLKLGRHIIITDELRRLRELHVGDKLPLATVTSGTVDYTVAGIVWSPGIDVIVSMFDMGLQFDQRTAWSVFGTLEDARRDFGVQGAYLFAANLTGPVDKEDFMKSVQKKLGEMNLRAGNVRHIKAAIQDEFTNILNLASTIAFAALAVASLGVTNTIMAAVRTRRWQFGILRSAGLTRWQLLRLVLAEALMIGVVGAILGLACGMVLSVDARALGIMITGFAPPLIFPRVVAAIGIASVLLVAVLASLWPALSVARATPLTLLQAGRSSA